MWKILRRAVQSPKYSMAVFSVLFCGVLPVFFLADLQARYSGAIDQAKKDALDHAQILAADTAVAFETVDRMLRETELIRQSAMLGSPADSDATNAALGHLAQTSPLVFAIAWTDSAGEVLAHSQTSATHRSNIGDMPHFAVQREKTDAGFFVAEPVLSPVWGKCFVATSRRLNDANGQFAGIVTADIDPFYFGHVYRSFNLMNKGAIHLLHRSGKTLAAEPVVQGGAGKSIADDQNLAELLSKSNSGSYETENAADGSERIVGYQAVAGLPLVVAVSYDRAEVLASWHRYLYQFGALLSLIVVLILSVTVMLVIQANKLDTEIGALKRRSKAVEQQNSWFDAALTNMPNGLSMFDADGNLMVWNDRYVELYGLTSELVRRGVKFKAIVEHKKKAGALEIDVETYIRELRHTLADVGRSTSTSRLKDGRTIFVVNTAIAGGGWVAIHEDITERVSHEKSIADQASQLARTNMRFNAALSNIGQGLCMFDGQKRLVVWNDRWAQLYQVPPHLAQVGTTYEEITNDRLARGVLKGESSEAALKIKASELAKLPANSARVDELADGRFVLLTRTPIEEGGWVSLVEDITERRRAEAEIVYLARHDALTGLSNRTEFNARLEEASNRLKRSGETFTVMMLDLDRFKAVNDTLGHLAGDKLLVEVGRRLQSTLRENDVLARLGGDEFAIIQECGSSQHEGAIALALRIINVLTEPFDLNGHQASVGTSIGIALAPEHGSEPHELLKKADLALYRVKTVGRNDFQLFQNELLELAHTEESAEIELRNAIAHEEFELYYQPVVDTQTRAICGVEALVRWRHPTKGLIEPDQFIPLAEKTGLILPLGEWILQCACADAAAWPKHIKIAINISPIQFQKGNLFDVILCTLVETGVAPERLELEITETSLLENHETHLTTIRQMKNLGISMALDDFGKGYSSINYLTNFPFDKIKIDKSFTQNALNRREYAAVISSVLALAQGLGTVTTAEGVETEAQLEYMRSVGVDLVQGYLFSPPVPIAQLDLNSVRLPQAKVA